MAFRADIADFAAFYEQSYPAVYRTALAVCGDAGLADEATQDAYLAAYRQRHRFRGDAPGVIWIQRIVVNAAISALRRRRIRRLEPLDALRHDRSDPAATSSFDSVGVISLLTVLEPRQRAAIVLRYYHDLDYASIGRILRTSEGNVGALLTRARMRLRAELDEPESSAGQRTAASVRNPGEVTS